MKLRSISALGAAFFLATGLAAAQSAEPEKRLACSDNQGGSRSRACEMREMTMAPSSRLDVSAAPNGGISVKGWSRSEILVRARVDAWGDTDAEAKQRLNEVRVVTEPARVRAEGPKNLLRNQNWSVSYEVFVPSRMDLGLDTVNGGVSVADIRGDIHVKTVNGGVSLARLAGKVKGETVNGGVSVELAGNTWDGEGFDVSTTNGGVTMDVPVSYSARFEARTTNGGMNTDLPNANVSGRAWGGRTLEATTGSGGPLVKVSTTNGGVRIRKKS